MDTTTHAGQVAVSGPAAPVVSTPARRALAALRIAFGLVFLWAFFDKLLALGFATGKTVDPATGTETVDRFGDAAWINGGSPTEGFLTYGTKGPFADFYQSFAGDAWADWLFMIGLLGIGLTLTLGMGMRVGTAAGAVLYVLMWTAYLPPDNNPVLDDHILGALSMIVLGLTAAGTTWGLGNWWNRTALVRSNHWLR
jgi:thiosulfate dehydrogenase [quinone] large subunit